MKRNQRDGHSGATPRTDAEAGYALTGGGYLKTGGIWPDPKGPYVHAEVAKELERELKRTAHALGDLVHCINARMTSGDPAIINAVFRSCARAEEVLAEFARRNQQARP